MNKHTKQNYIERWNKCCTLYRIGELDKFVVGVIVGVIIATGFAGYMVV